MYSTWEIRRAFSSVSSGEKSGSRHIRVICSVTWLAVSPIKLLGPAEVGRESEIIDGIESKDSCPLRQFAARRSAWSSLVSVSTTADGSSSANGMESSSASWHNLDLILSSLGKELGFSMFKRNDGKVCGASYIPITWS